MPLALSFGIKDVSIRSPHKSKGRPVPPAANALTGLFQSAPLTKARGDRLPRAANMGDLGVSIRSPHKSKGRPELAKDNAEIAKVSIRSPHKSKGRLRITATTGPRLQFQSAPLTKARGDKKLALRAFFLRGFNPLPSQKQGETRTRGVGDPPLRLFQSAPLTKARGDVCAVAPRPRCTSFNPLPSQKQGETHGYLTPITLITRFNPLPSQKQGETLRTPYRLSNNAVSIRSPHKSKGRRQRYKDGASV